MADRCRDPLHTAGASRNEQPQAPALQSHNRLRRSQLDSVLKTEHSSAPFPALPDVPPRRALPF